ncbi:unnamed protein product [Brugia pahangi]|uniref:Transposase n=1 Tax=Brugia pahangi TaxID=6280 RepID=A0A0N4TJX6_BRUPA|nr:unnamed protein product [Brugia pahangi]
MMQGDMYGKERSIAAAYRLTTLAMSPSAKHVYMREWRGEKR